MNPSSTIPRIPKTEIQSNAVPFFRLLKFPLLAYFISRVLLIQVNEAEFTDGYQLLTWSFDHPVRWHPLYPLLIKPLTLFLDPIIAGRVVSIGCGAAAMIALTRLTEKLYGSRAGIAMGWIYAVSPLFWWCNLRVLTESTFQFFFCLSIYFLVLYSHEYKRFAAPAFILTSGLSALTRPEGFVLLPFVFYVLFREFFYRKTVVFVAAALIPWIVCLYWSFAVSSSDSYSDIFVFNITEFQYGHAFGRLFSYIEAYPYIAFYPLFAFALIHLARRERTRIWGLLLLYIHAVFLVMLFFHPAWSTRFLLIPLSLLLVEAAAGLSRRRWPLKAIVIGSCFVFSLLSIYLQKGMFSDFKRSAIAVKGSYANNRVISDEQAKTEYYLEKAIVPYEPNVELRKGDVLLLHSYNTDLSKAKELLDARYYYRPLLSTETSIIPLLGSSALGEMDYTNSPIVLLQRFHRQRFQSVVVMIDGLRKGG